MLKAPSQDIRISHSMLYPPFKTTSLANSSFLLMSWPDISEFDMLLKITLLQSATKHSHDKADTQICFKREKNKIT